LFDERTSERAVDTVELMVKESRETGHDSPAHEVITINTCREEIEASRRLVSALLPETQSLPGPPFSICSVAGRGH